MSVLRFISHNLRGLLIAAIIAILIAACIVVLLAIGPGH